MSDSTSDPLAAALLPVVIHELNNATQMLSSLNAVLALPGGEDFLRERAADMASVGDEVLELGWLVAMLSSAAGSDMLQARRHAHGLDIMVRLVRKALRREGRDLARCEGPLPQIDPRAGRGWEPAWALGLLLWHAGLAAPDTVSWNWSCAEGAWIFEVDQRLPELDSLNQLLSQRCPQGEFRQGRDSTQLRLPLRTLEVE
jgi:hypothetical protein